MFEAVVIFHFVNYLGRSELSVLVAVGCFEEELCFPSLSLSFSSLQHEAAAAPVAEEVPSVVLPLPLPAAAAVAALLTTAAPPFHGLLPPVGPSPPAEETETHSVVSGKSHFCFTQMHISKINLAGGVAFFCLCRALLAALELEEGLLSALLINCNRSSTRLWSSTPPSRSINDWCSSRFGCSSLRFVKRRRSFSRISA